MTYRLEVRGPEAGTPRFLMPEVYNLNRWEDRWHRQKQGTALGRHIHFCLCTVSSILQSGKVPTPLIGDDQSQAGD